MAKKNQTQEKKTKKLSSFDGKVSGRIGVGILALFAFLIPLLPAGGLAVLALTLFADLDPNLLIAIYVAIGVFAFFMLFLGAAWASVVALRWEIRHWVINGKRFVFKGKARGLWGNYLKWFFLSVITLLFYGLWVGAKFGQWVLSNVETVESEETENKEKNAVNAYLPTANPYFPQAQQANDATQGQPPFPYFPPYPYFPPMPPYPFGNPQDTQNAQNKKHK